MGNDDERAPRMRDLADERQPVAGVPDIGRVGDVGELPYAVEDEGDGDEGSRTPVLVGAAVVVLLLLVVVVLLVA